MVFKSIFVYPKYAHNLQKLHEMAYNLWSTWNYDAINLFYGIDATIFRQVNHNPVKFLLSLPRETIDRLASDTEFLAELDRVWQNFRQYMDSRGLADQDDANGILGPGDRVAYFSMEFGLHESLPLYGGGLGILAGDFLKAASDMDIPVTGVGLMYKCGYFTQRVNMDGYQEELLNSFENHLLALRELTFPSGHKAYVNVRLAGADVKIKLWQVEVGKATVLLLDTDVEDNPPGIRDITRQLYVADREKRLQQELVLGLGGVKALELLNAAPTVYHMNEGHSSFLVLPRLRKLMAERKLSFAEARNAVRSGTVFTTHTPVLAGNENFETTLVRKYLEPYAVELGISFDQLAEYGFVDGNTGLFCLPAFAMRFSAHVNAVSRLHGDVSRRMWASLFPQTPIQEIPITYITNGVHKTWLSEPFTDIVRRTIGLDAPAGSQQEAIEQIRTVPDEEIWNAHCHNKAKLAEFVRRTMAEQLGARGYPKAKISRLAKAFNPDTLTVVFAKRFAYYKRPTLVLEDKQRLHRILTNPQKPVQLIFAGKAHPADMAGKKMIKDIIDFARDYKIEDKVVFLENYDINVARHLVWGADVWLNTPVIENEASGTSGMKAAINGVLNLSVLDGWWPEAYNGNNGWAINADQFAPSESAARSSEAAQVYTLLEDEISELYYNRDCGVPRGWVEMMRNSITSIYHPFGMNRVIKSYVNDLYLPAVRRCRQLVEENCRPLKEAGSVEHEVLKHWNSVRFLQLSTSADGQDHLVENDSLNVTCTIDLGAAPRELFHVELFYLQDGDRYRIIPMQPTNGQCSPITYGCNCVVEGYGLQNINVRVTPASKIVREARPDLIKWKD